MEREEPFSNDRLTDAVLHQEHDAAAGEEKTQDNVPPGACSFPIHFGFRGVDYTADVQKHGEALAEYHVTGVHPSIDHLPDPYIVAEHISKEKYDFPVNEDYYPESLGAIIVSAITYALDTKPGGNFF